MICVQETFAEFIKGAWKTLTLADEFFKKFDADNSGELDKEEAKALVKAIRPDIFQ